MDSQFNKFVPDIIFYDSITQHCLSFQFNWYVALFVLEGRRIQVLFLCFRQFSLCKDSISRYYSKRSARQLIFYKNFYKSVSSIVFSYIYKTGIEVSYSFVFYIQSFDKSMNYKVSLYSYCLVRINRLVISFKLIGL